MAKRILIVDDEPDVLGALVRAFKIAGYSVASATGASDAIDQCKDHAFDLVILDFIMPGGTGLDTLNKIRAFHPTVRSIIISGKVDPQLTEDEVDTRLKTELETDAFLSKPASNDRLLETTARLLSLGANETWKDVAKRSINAAKRPTQVRKVEKSLKTKRGPRKP